MEFILTFIMTLVVYAVSHPNRIASGSLRDKAVTIGFVAAVLNFVAVCSFCFCCASLSAAVQWCQLQSCALFRACGGLWRVGASLGMFLYVYA